MSLGFALANVDRETGIRFGVISGNTVPDLLSDIMDNGTNADAEYLLGELVEQLQGASKEEAGNVVNQYLLFDDQLALDKYTYPLSEESAQEIAEDIASSVEYDEPIYYYSEETEQGTLEYEILYLGGAPLVFVKKSPFVTYCLECSPCVPFAGDLDSLVDEQDGRAVLAYCIHPRDFPEGQDAYEVVTLENNLLLVRRKQPNG